MAETLPEPQFQKLTMDEFVECLTAFDDHIEELCRQLGLGTEFMVHLVDQNPDRDKFRDCLHDLRRARQAAGDALADFRAGIGMYARQFKAERQANAEASRGRLRNPEAQNAPPLRRRRENHAHAAGNPALAEELKRRDFANQVPDNMPAMLDQSNRRSRPSARGRTVTHEA